MGFIGLINSYSFLEFQNALEIRASGDVQKALPKTTGIAFAIKVFSIVQ
jgi:hypothetical protein